MASQRRILYVQGFHPATRARDLAFEFEKFGRLVRCDVPARRDGQRASYAFIEFRDEREANDAYYEMHNKSFEGHRLSVQWAKNPPSSVWRFDNKAPGGQAPPPPASSRRSPRDDRDRGDPRDYRARDDYDRGRDRDRELAAAPLAADRDTRRRSRSPIRRDDRDRPSYDRERPIRRDDRDRDRDYRPASDLDRDRRRRSLSPRDRIRTPPRESIRSERDRDRDIERPLTPPYER